MLRVILSCRVFVCGMTRRLAIALALLAGSLLVAVASASDEPAGSGSARPGPPTSGEVERATNRFLESADGSTGAPATASGGSGGTSQGSGGDGLLADNRVVAFYGAPQMGATIVGRKSISGAKRKLRRQARGYRGRGRAVIPGFDLVAAIATSDRGRDGRFRSRQPNRVIARYHNAARRLDGRLILDIQPGRSPFTTEVKALKEWVVRSNVDIALDPEWNVGRRGRPGRSTGSVNAKMINRVSGYMSRVIERENLPNKALVIHQFRQGSVKKRNRIKQPDGVDVVLNFDGIGSAAAKKAGYARLTREGLFAGFSLFFRLDQGLMSPKQVLRLRPEPDFLLYQ